VGEKVSLISSSLLLLILALAVAFEAVKAFRKKA
jgi:hypothetical protein